MKRTRSILKLPQGQGRLCPVLAKSDILPCNTQLCAKECVDAVWDAWSSWGKCSSSCEGGVAQRHRSVLREADDCGHPPVGDFSEWMPCNQAVSCHPTQDCQWGQWGLWTDCSGTCFGQSSRSRNIEAPGAGGGLTCEGPSQQTKQCNPDRGKEPPGPCKPKEPVNCQLSQWSTWETCSTTCGSGYQSRSRTVLQPPAHGGKACERVYEKGKQIASLTTLAQVQTCTVQACIVVPAVDCLLSSWSEWGECTKCSGERLRTRAISTVAQHGGAACPKTPGEHHVALAENGKCPRRCGDQVYCEWNDWVAWSQCSATCGTGMRKRSRKLVWQPMQVGTAVPAGLVEENKKLRERIHLKMENLQSQRLQDVVIAFSTGCLSFSLLLAVMRCTASRGVSSAWGTPTQSSYAPLHESRRDGSMREGMIEMGQESRSTTE